MISNNLLKLVSGILIVTILGVIIFEIIQENPAMMSPVDTRIEEGVFAGDPTVISNANDSNSENQESMPIESPAIAAEPGSRLTVGIIGATPSQSEVVTISEIPWLTSQVNRAFRDADNSACTLLTPDLPLDPVLAASRPGTRRSLGRIPALTVGLEVDESSKNKLPVATRGAIQGYLKEHRLAIEPTVYESEDVKLYFGTDCRAAFYRQSSPSRTVKAEPMIDEAIGRFRSLGVLGGELAQDGRTLLMAFRYVKSSDRLTSVAGGLETETELLFLHLDADATTQKLSFKAFVTSDERQKLHELAVGGSVLRQTVPTITASIRFDSFVMMGMYPAEPVVTGVRHQATGTLPVSSIRLLTNDKLSQDKVTFEEVLDRFDEFSHRTDLIQ